MHWKIFEFNYWKLLLSWIVSDEVEEVTKGSDVGDEDVKDNLGLLGSEPPGDVARSCFFVAKLTICIPRLCGDILDNSDDDKDLDGDDKADDEEETLEEFINDDDLGCVHDNENCDARSDFSVICSRINKHL